MGEVLLNAVRCVDALSELSVLFFTIDGTSKDVKFFQDTAPIIGN
jgi:hypothetical protein